MVLWKSKTDVGLTCNVLKMAKGEKRLKIVKKRFPKWHFFFFLKGRKETITLCVFTVCTRVKRLRCSWLDNKKYGKTAEAHFSVCITTFAGWAALVCYWKSRTRIEFSVTTRSYDTNTITIPSNLSPSNAPFFPVVIEFERYIFSGVLENKSCTATQCRKRLVSNLTYNGLSCLSHTFYSLRVY